MIKSIIRVCLMWTLLIAVFALGAVTHESDIRRSCMNSGATGNSAWLVDFKCEQQTNHNKGLE